MTRMMLGGGESSTGKVILIESIHGEEVSPSDEEFKAHFESVLNPCSVPPDCDVSTDVTIPVLDCHTSPADVSDQVKNLSR